MNSAPLGSEPSDPRRFLRAGHGSAPVLVSYRPGSRVAGDTCQSFSLPQNGSGSVQALSALPPSGALHLGQRFHLLSTQLSKLKILTFSLAVPAPPAPSLVDSS